MEKFLIDMNISKKIHTSNGFENLEVAIQIPEFQLVTIFGKSGVGKTTLLRILAGLTKPDKGYIRIGNETWFDSEKRINVKPQKRNIGFVFQDYALFPNMTVREHLLFAQPKIGKDDISKLLEVFQLDGLHERKPAKLSGGQQQRLALARAFARKPPILLLDEPLSALDNETRDILQNEIMQAHKDFNATTLLVSHDINEVLKLSDYVYVIDKGKVKESGKPSEIFNHILRENQIQFSAKIVNIENNVLTISYNDTITKIEIEESGKYKIGDTIAMSITFDTP
jgi:molybdate transport system ATP-binding protein